MNTIRSLMMTLAMGLCAAACTSSAVQGDGRTVSETRTVPAFSSVEADTDIDVQVTRGDATAVVVTTDENLVPLITTRVVGSTLVVDQQGRSSRIPRPSSRSPFQIWRSRSSTDRAR